MSVRFELQRVQYMPKDLSPGVLYVSEEFKTAAHLCACGCGRKVRTPLGPAEWTFRETNDGPSLTPSIGNWQFPCRSHYWIRRGEVIPAKGWTPAQIAAGRRAETARREEYVASAAPPPGFLERVWNWVTRLGGHR